MTRNSVFSAVVPACIALQLATLPIPAIGQDLFGDLSGVTRDSANMQPVEREPEDLIASRVRYFRALRLAAEVKRPTSCRYQPRLHDLRHTMATHCLVNAYRTGADVQALLVNLSAYLGHVDLSGTQKYLTMTPDLRQQASARFARYALGGSHE